MKFSQKVYVRKLNNNELGYKNGKVGSERGPAILVSKKLVNFFPPLSDTEFNDQIPISLCIEGSKKSILLNYIYFNGKRVYNQTNGRDEKRIYISKDHYDFFKPSEYFAFYKVTLQDDIFFYVRKIDISQDNKVSLETLLNNKNNFLDTQGNHLEIKKSELDLIIGDIAPPNSVENEVDPKVVSSLNGNTINTTRARPRIDLEADDDLDLFENSSFRKLVLFFYGKQCAISKNNIIYKQAINLEVAHIKWHAEGGLSHPTNGIPLCRDLHWAFDRGMFTINHVGNDYKIVIHPKVNDNPYLKEFDSTFLNQPNDKRYLPKDEYLDWHRDNIFGNFTK